MKTKSRLSILIITFLISLQMLTISAAHAAGDTPSFGVFVGTSKETIAVGDVFGSNQWVHICTGGTGTLTSIQFSFSSSNINFTGISVAPASGNNDAQDRGSIDGSYLWTGELVGGQCLLLIPQGEITGNVGDTITFSATITGATISGGDPADLSHLGPASYDISLDIAPPSDMTVVSRLMTTGIITSGSNVNYELLIKNIGAGDFDNNIVQAYFVLPEGATSLDITDLDTNDTVTPLGCTLVAADINNMYPSHHGPLYGCAFSNSLNKFPAGSSYPMQLSMSATQDFISGTTEVYFVVIANGEPDTTTFLDELTHGGDPFVMLGNNNINHLTYDANALRVTINRCVGVGAVVTTNEACFTVTFSKPIWAPSFTADDLVLTGGGSVSSFTQDSSTQWTVRIANMPLGGTISLTLGADSVLDYSAVYNDVRVLGENTVRYGTADGSAASTLPKTGRSLDVYNALALILIGSFMVFGSKKLSLQTR